MNYDYVIMKRPSGHIMYVLVQYCRPCLDQKEGVKIEFLDITF
jgi:hypothetical protein